MKRLLINCLIVTLLGVAVESEALSFRQVFYHSRGMIWSFGAIKGYDANADGFEDLIFTTALRGGTAGGILFNRYQPYNHFVSQDSIIGPIFWDMGYFDSDSLLDMVVHEQDSISFYYVRVYESAHRDSFPKVRAWEWRYEYSGMSAYENQIDDLDRDGRKDMLFGDLRVVYVFENTGDNQYQKVFVDTITLTPYPLGWFGIEDFDGDGRTEFVTGGVSRPPNVFVYENTGDNTYEMVDTISLQTRNCYDVISCPDLDGDLKPEFFVGSAHLKPDGWTAVLWLFEAVADNQYSTIYVDSIVGLINRTGYDAHSGTGDVDRDGRSELVWAIDRDWMVYKSNGNNQFQRVFSAYGDNGHNSTNIHIHDMNGNGYPEIIESGRNETHIWEVEACQVVYPNGGETLYWDSSCGIRFRNVSPFQADSFSLFFSSDSGYTYTPIAHGIPSSDSTYLWPVPQVNSSTCFLMLWAYQNATGWDFSDGPFTISNGSGVEVFPPHASRLTPYVVSPNPP